MIGFLLKKNFFDGWDSLFRLVLLNLGFYASLAVPIFVPPLLAAAPLLSLALFIAGIIWCFVYLAAVSGCVTAISDYRSFTAGDFIVSLKALWPAGLVAGGLALLMFFLIRVVIPFYINMESLVGLLLAAIVFWTLVLSLLALQFFFPVRNRLSASLIKSLKKCFIIFFDNPAFAFFSLLGGIVHIALTPLLAFLLPGPAGLLLFVDQGLRLRLLKYDYLEEHPDANRRQIPWDALLIDERERTGTRSLRNFIFPWKD